MAETFKSIIKKTRFFLTLYFLFLGGVAYMLVNYSGVNGTILINRTWTDFQDLFFINTTHLGGGQIALIIVFFIVLLVSIRKGIVAFSAFVFTALITQCLKHLVFPNEMRPFIKLWNEFKSGDLHLVLPEELMKKGNSFPSGHTTSAFSVFLILTLFTRKPSLGILFCILAAVASYSRVYLGQHFFEDIFSGSIVGVFGTLVIYFFFEYKHWFQGLDLSLIKLIKNAKKTI